MSVFGKKEAEKAFQASEKAGKKEAAAVVKPTPTPVVPVKVEAVKPDLKAFVAHLRERMERTHTWNDELEQTYRSLK